MFPLSDSIKSGKFPFFNILLIAATIFVFVQQLFASNPEGFIKTYALIPSQVNIAYVNTLLPFVTAIFLHGGFLHIITNMWFLWIFGDDVEAYLGKLPFLFLYFAAGITGNIVQYLLMSHSSIPMLGASGAVAGILGAYYILFPYAKIKTLVPFFGFFTIIDIAAPIMLGYWFLLQLLSGVGSLAITAQSGGVAFWAHVGGFITGVIVAKLAGGQKSQEEVSW